MKPWNPNQSLDVLVCGFSIARIDPSRPYAFLHGNATRAFGLANNFSFQGWRTGLIVEPDCVTSSSPLLSNELCVVPRSAFVRAAAATCVLVLACTNLKSLHLFMPEAFIVNHPRKWVASCFDNNDEENVSSIVEGVVGISFDNEFQAQSWNARGFAMSVHVVPYGVDEFPYVDAAIMPSVRPTALWIGVLRLPFVLERIVRFAEVNPECDVKIVSGLVFDESLIPGMVGSRAQPYINYKTGIIPQSQFAEVVSLWCKRSAPANLQYLGTCLGQDADLLGRADVALAFSRRLGQTHDDAKILGYLRSGTPVLCDDGQPSYRFVQETGHGYVMPFTAGDEVLREGFQRCLALSSLQMRRAVAVQVRDRYGWPTVARQVREWILSDIKTTVKAADQTLQPDVLTPNLITSEKN